MENNLRKRFLSRGKREVMSNFRTKYLKIACNLLWAVFLLIFAVHITSKIADLFYAVCGGNDFCDDRKSDGEVSGETDQN